MSKLTANMPINILEWFNANKENFKPPVGNRLIYGDDDWRIRAIMGQKSSRKDYHYSHRGPELFYQVKGDMTLRIMSSEGKTDVIIKEGEFYLMPSETIHSPQRPEGSWGVVIESKPKNRNKDFILWFCDKCDNKLGKFAFDLNNIREEVPPIYDKFYDSEKSRTCNKCKTVMEVPDYHIKKLNKVSSD